MTTSISGSLAATNLLCMALLTISVPARAIDDMPTPAKAETMLAGNRIIGKEPVADFDAPAPGEPETMLAGIRISQTRLSDVIRMYGPPTQKPGVYGSITISPADLLTFPSYVWTKSCVVLYVTGPSRVDHLVQTMLVTISDSGCIADGPVKGPIAQTGSGLRLGDDKTAWNRIYGNQLGFVGESPDSNSAEGFWRERDESFIEIDTGYERHPCFRRTRFAAEFNAAGKITLITLEQLTPSCPPGDAPPTSPVSSKKTSTPHSDVLGADYGASQIESAPREETISGDRSLRARRNQPYERRSDNFLTVDEYYAIWRDNPVAGKARFIAMGTLNIRGRVHFVGESDIVLTGIFA